MQPLWSQQQAWGVSSVGIMASVVICTLLTAHIGLDQGFLQYNCCSFDSPLLAESTYYKDNLLLTFSLGDLH
jgi:hypothetical protein